MCVPRAGPLPVRSTSVLVAIIQPDDPNMCTCSPLLTSKSVSLYSGLMRISNSELLPSIFRLLVVGPVAMLIVSWRTDGILSLDSLHCGTPIVAKLGLVWDWEGSWVDLYSVSWFVITEVGLDTSIQHWRFCLCTEYFFHDGFQFSCSSVSFAGRCTGCPSQSMFALSYFMLLSSPSMRPSEFVIALTDSLCNLERICSSSFPCFWAGIDLAQPWISNFETVWGFRYCKRSSVLRCLTLC